MASLWNSTFVAISHLLKVSSTYAYVKDRLLSTGYWPNGNMISDKIGILPKCGHVSTTVWLHHLNFKKTLQEKDSWELHKDADVNNSREQKPTKQWLYGHLPSISQTIQARWATHAEHSWVMFSHGFLHMDIPVLAEPQKLTFISSVQILGTVLWTYQAWWLIGMDGERIKGIHVVGVVLSMELEPKWSGKATAACKSSN